MNAGNGCLKGFYFLKCFWPSVFFHLALKRSIWVSRKSFSLLATGLVTYSKWVYWIAWTDPLLSSWQYIILSGQQEMRINTGGPQYSNIAYYMGKCLMYMYIWAHTHYDIIMQAAQLTCMICMMKAGCMCVGSPSQTLMSCQSLQHFCKHCNSHITGSSRMNGLRWFNFY